MVRRQIDILAPGGGFVFNQVHNIQANVPVGEHRRHVGRGAGVWRI